ncbi:MAG TPA: hypothetical protein VGB43_01420, partial [Flavobacterium sp.]
IQNLQTENSTSSTEGGYFSIPAAVGDTLMFSAVQFKGRRVAVTKEAFGNELFFVHLEGMINPLEEVKIITYNNINAVSLGIIPKGQKKYTPAQRKLNTAAGNAGIGPGASIDPLINWISGRTAMLKKEVKVERNEFLLAKITQMWNDDYFTQSLKIPVLYVRGFQYYALDNRKFIDAVNNKNKFMATFLLGELAADYRKIIGDEK